MKGQRIGGRAAGTPNKVSAAVRASIAKMLDGYFNSEDFAKDLAELDPRDRVSAMEKFAAYVAPKLQTTNLDLAMETKRTIEDKLVELADDKEEV